MEGGRRRINQLHLRHPDPTFVMPIPLSSSPRTRGPSRLRAKIEIPCLVSPAEVAAPDRLELPDVGATVKTPCTRRARWVPAFAGMTREGRWVCFGWKADLVKSPPNGAFWPMADRLFTSRHQVEAERPL